LSLTRALFLKLCLIHVTLATTFHPNCTIPPEGSNYVAEPNVRSTFNILWNAIYTIFVCTWAIQHLNVPAQELRKRSRTRRFLTSFWTKLKWMLVTIMLPEYLVGKAFGDYISTRRFKKDVESFKKDMKSDEETVSRNETVVRNEEPSSQTEEISSQKEWTVTHAYYANSGGFLLEFPSRDEPTAINTAQLIYLLQNKVIDSTPTIGKDEIEEKGESDLFAKLIAILQLLWLVIQLISRKVLNLPSTKIEISALSFAICSLVTYTLWTSKPQNPKIPTYISLNPDSDWEMEPLALAQYPKLDLSDYLDLSNAEYSALDREEQLRQSLELYLARLVPSSFFTQALFAWKHTRTLGETFPNDRYNWSSVLWLHQYGDPMPLGRKTGYVSFKGEDMGFVLGTVILGACHCIAWNFDFPTPIERTLWRVAIIIIVTIMPVYYLLWFGHYLLEKTFDFESSVGDATLSWLAYTLFGLARLYLLGAAFRDLFYLPPEAFITTWAASFPAFG
jgi:hypothetical protein